MSVLFLAAMPEAGMFSSSADVLGDIVATVLPTMPPRTARLFAALRSLRPVHAAPCLAAAVGCALLYTGAESARLGRWANPLLVHAHSQAQPVFRVDPETSIEFPATLPLATPSPPLTLVGLGVRKVSFLKIKVYSAGFYLQEGATRCLHHIPGWAVSPEIPAPFAPCPCSSSMPDPDIHRPASPRSPVPFARGRDRPATVWRSPHGQLARPAYRMCRSDRYVILFLAWCLSMEACGATNVV